MTSARSSGARAKSFGRSARSSKRAPRARAPESTSTSSSPRSAPTTLAVAQVVAPHGLAGELSCNLLTDFPDRFARTSELLAGDPSVAYPLEGHRFHNGRLLLKLGGIDDREAALTLRGAVLQVPVEAAMPLPDGSFYWHQLIGLRVFDERDRFLGELAEVLPTGSNDVYLVRGPFGEVLLPAIRDVIRTVDLDSGLLRVQLIPGLLESG